MAVNRHVNPSLPTTVEILRDKTDEAVHFLFDNVPIKLSSVAGSNNITAVADPTLDGYANGQTYTFVVAATNTGAVNINIDNRGDQDVFDEDGNELAAGALVAGRFVWIRRHAGAFRLLGSNASNLAISNYIRVFEGDSLFAIEDASGNRALEIDEDGLLFAQPQRLFSPGADLVRSRDFGFADAGGILGLTLTDDGIVEAALADIRQVYGVNLRKLLDAQQAAANIPAKVLHFLLYGQSRAGGSKGYPITGIAAEYGGVTFAGGVRAFEVPGDPNRRTSLIGLVEKDSGDNKGQTIATGFNRAFSEMLRLENKITPGEVQCLISSSFLGNTALADLSKGTATYDELIADAVAGEALCPSYFAAAVILLQGETDVDDETLPATFEGLLTDFQVDVETDFNTELDRTGDLYVITDQIVTHKSYGKSDPAIALAQLNVFNAVGSKVMMACPGYIHSFIDNIHHDSYEYDRLGAYCAWMAKRLIIDGVEPDDLRPLSPNGHSVIGDTATLTFPVRVGGLRIDTLNVRDNTFGLCVFGFQLFEADGTTPIEILSVEVFPPRGNTLRIVAAESIPTNAVLKYAHDGVGTAGYVDGPRGNLRDEQGESEIFNGYEIHNFAPIFRRVLS